jgi:hypothetical protein
MTPTPEGNGDGAGGVGGDPHAGGSESSSSSSSSSSTSDSGAEDDLPHDHRQEERFIDAEEEKECLRKMKDLQYKGDIQDYIVKMEALNYQVCLSGIAWRESLHSGLNEDIKDRPSFSKLITNDDAEYELLLRQVGHAYERRLQEKKTPS